MHYTPSQWLMFLFAYCFLGWIWESLYVSIRKREWVNRGFLRGPMLPIYGFGAVIILYTTAPYLDNLSTIYLLGMLGATILEYGTGSVLVQLFSTRYWDYSDQPFNLKGHISLFTSLGWGVFSILLVEFIHPNLENIVFNFPHLQVDLINLTLLILIIVDTTVSVQDALNKKEPVTRVTSLNKKSENLEKKFE